MTSLWWSHDFSYVTSCYYIDYPNFSMFKDNYLINLQMCLLIKIWCQRQYRSGTILKIEKFKFEVWLFDPRQSFIHLAGIWKQILSTKYINQILSTKYINQILSTKYINQILSTKYSNQILSTKYITQILSTKYSEPSILNQIFWTKYSFLLNNLFSVKHINLIWLSLTHLLRKTCQENSAVNEIKRI